MVIGGTMIKIPELKIGNLIAKMPVIQGGMGVGISMSGLAAAVANEGGIGVISSIGLGLMNNITGYSKKETNRIGLIDEIRKARVLTTGIIGVNVMVALTDYDDLCKTALEEEIDILFIGAGLPLKIPNGVTIDFIKKVKTKIVPIVSSSRAAKLIFSSWAKRYDYVPDAVVVEGPLAGGHLGFNKDTIQNKENRLEEIVPEVVSELTSFEEKFGKKITVIAAGGIYSGQDISKIMNIGASGVQMGTRFVATEECDADIEFKNAFIKSKEKDIVIIKSPVGLPGRAISNKFIEDVERGVKKPFKCDWKCLKTCNYKKALYCIAEALINAKNGDLISGFSFAGANAYKIDRILSVKELMQTLKTEFEKIENYLHPVAGTIFA